MREDRGTVYHMYMRPVIRYIVELGEAFALAVFFFVASKKIDSIILDVFSYIMFLVVAALAGLPIGFAGRQLDRFKTKDLRIALLIALPLGLPMAFACHLIGLEVSHLIRELGTIQSK